MLEWIVIALVIALIFGVIRVDDLKQQWEKLQPRLKELWNKLKNWSETKAKTPSFNLALGQTYLQQLMRLPAVQNNLIYMAVAYNAGPGNLIKWKKQMNYPKDPLLFVESIPSKETRTFVERIIVNYWIYSALMGQSLTSLDETIAGHFPIYAQKPK